MAHKKSRNRVLGEIVRRIVEVAHPEKIILFGSAARGEVGPNSDVDLLVVKSGVHRRHLAQEIYTHMIGLEQAVDVVVVTAGSNWRPCCAAPCLLEASLIN